MSWNRLQGWGVVCGLAVGGLLSTNLKAEDAAPAVAAPAVSPAPAVKTETSAPVVTPAATAPAAGTPQVATAAPVAAPAPAVDGKPAAAPAGPNAALGIVPLVPISTTCWEPDSEYKAKLVALKTNSALEQQDQIRRLIARLASPGWAEASEDLIKMGRPAVPHLIAALDVPADPAEPYKAAAFNLQGPTRYTRQRPVAETAFDVLNNLIRNHSTYTGPVPSRDQAEWQKFWAEQGGSIKLGFEQ